MVPVLKRSILSLVLRCGLIFTLQPSQIQYVKQRLVRIHPCTYGILVSKIDIVGLWGTTYQALIQKFYKAGRMATYKGVAG